MAAYGVNAEKAGRLLESFNRSQGGYIVRVFRAGRSDDERGSNRYNGLVGGLERHRLQLLRKGQLRARAHVCVCFSTPRSPKFG